MNQEDTRRCGWCKSDPVYLKYHDEEWGKEVTENYIYGTKQLRKLFNTGEI